MKPQKRTTIIINAKKPDGTSIRRSVAFIKEGCRYYHNAQHLLLKLERGERAFYDYLCEHMDASNRITIDKELRDGFIEFVEKVTSKSMSYKQASLPQFSQKLNVLGLITKTGTGNSGFYIVNPKYVYKGPETERQSLLKRLIEERICKGQSIEPLIDRPEQEFLSGSDSE